MSADLGRGCAQVRHPKHGRRGVSGLPAIASRRRLLHQSQGDRTLIAGGASATAHAFERHNGPPVGRCNERSHPLAAERKGSRREKSAIIAFPPRHQRADVCAHRQEAGGCSRRTASRWAWQDWTRSCKLRSEINDGSVRRRVRKAAGRQTARIGRCASWLVFWSLNEVLLAFRRQWFRPPNVRMRKHRKAFVAV